MNFATFTTTQSTLSSLALGAALFAAGLPAADALTLDFASIPNSAIRFTGTGDVVTFPSAPSARGFQITDSDGFGDSVGLRGAISGNFKIDAIQSTPTPAGQLQSANIIAGTGKLSIWDTSNKVLSADLTFATISTLGRTGGLDAGLTGLNLTNFSYGGTNKDLLDLYHAGKATQAMTFQFGTVKNLTYLTVNGRVTNTSYSGTINAVPIPAAAWLFGSALVGVAGIGRRNQSSQQQASAA
jgi:hypothetical protein